MCGWGPPIGCDSPSSAASGRNRENPAPPPPGVWGQSSPQCSLPRLITRCKKRPPALTAKEKSLAARFFRDLRRRGGGHQSGSTSRGCAPHSGLWNNKFALVVRLFAAKRPRGPGSQAIGSAAPVTPYEAPETCLLANPQPSFERDAGFDCAGCCRLASPCFG